MRFLLVLLLLCFVIVVSTQSCQKDHDPPRTDTLVVSHTDTLLQSDTVYIKEPTSIFGLWIGTYDVTNGPDAGRTGFYYSYELHSDSTMQATGLGGDGLTYYGLGTWSLKGNLFNAHVINSNLSYVGFPQTIVGMYDSTGRKLTGNITDDLDASYGASFSLEKVQ